METKSAWRTWKPYAGIGAATLAAYWWFSSESSLAPLKDGSYECTGVYVNGSGKYEALTNDAGNRFYGEASIRDGELVSLSGDVALTSAQIKGMTMRTKGNSHFHVTDDPAMKMYDAVACDLAS